MLSYLLFKRKTWYASHMSSTVASIETRIRQIHHELAELGDFRPGSLSQQFNVCGRPDCKCKADPPQKHGPYYNLSYTRKRKSHTRFIRKDAVDAVKLQVQNYQRFRELVEEWVDLAVELCDIKLKTS